MNIYNLRKKETLGLSHYKVPLYLYVQIYMEIWKTAKVDRLSITIL